MQEEIFVLDFGTQPAQLIPRRIRECGVYSQIVPCDISVESVRQKQPKGIIFSGRPAENSEGNFRRCDPELFNLGIPFLDFCYGVQEPVSEQSDVQYPPEVIHTPLGMNVFRRFVKDTCGCQCTWTMKNFAAAAIERFRNEIGGDQVICGLSGGVDSAVVAAILSKAIGRQLKCIFVDSGLMRKGEVENVVEAFEGHFDAELHVVKATDGFLERLAGVEEPQEKRRRIGHYFIDVFSEAAKKFTNARHLAQGTIYPDIIESGATLHQEPGKPAAGNPAAIKLHHNVGGLPEKLGFHLVEPLRELFKDEVRKLGIELGLPEEFVGRHPFPGPGLAVRCLGEVTQEKLDRLRDADAIVIDEIRQAGLYRNVSQVFAVLLPVKSVGVSGDSRTYEDAVAIRCVATDDFMTADWVALPDAVLRKMSSRIINEVQGVNRVVYDISSKPPATIEWE